MAAIGEAKRDDLLYCTGERPKTTPVREMELRAVQRLGKTWQQPRQDPEAAGFRKAKVLVCDAACMHPRRIDGTWDLTLNRKRYCVRIRICPECCCRGGEGVGYSYSIEMW